MPPRTLIYVRRSSDRDDHQILSIEQQLDVLRDLALKRGIDVDQELIENASASQPGRPVFSELMKLIRQGKAERVLVWRLDRLARNMVDGGALIYELQEGRLKELVTPEASYTGTGDAKFMLAMLFGAAAKYTDDLSAAIRRGNADVLRKGKVPGPVPLGYMKTHEHEILPGSGTVIPDPERFDAVKRIWMEVLTGEANVSEVWRKARYEWGLTTRPTKGTLAKPIGLANMYVILRNPFYAGQVRRPNGTTKGEHPSMVTLAQFERVQEILNPRHHQKSEPHHFLYQGLLRCGDCGRAFTGETHTKPSGRSYTYYHCGRRRAGFYACPAPEVREEDMTAEIAALLDNVIVDPQVQEWAYEAIAWWAADDEVSPEKLVRRAKAALARAEAELVTLTDMLLSDLVSQAEYKVRRVNQLAKIAHCREVLVEPVEKLATWRSRQKTMQQHGLNLGQQFREGDDVTKRKIVTRTCSSILVHERKPRLELRTPFVLRLKEMNLQDGLRTRATAA